MNLQNQKQTTVPNIAQRFGRTGRKVFFLLGIIVVFGCITVNVNFPESAVQRAADDFVDDLYGSPEEEKKPSKRPSTSWWSGELFASALAADINAPGREPKFRTPNTKKYIDQLKARRKELNKLKEAGVVGETIDGDLAIKDSKNTTPEIKKFVDEENRIREKLFETVAEDNQMGRSGIKSIRGKMSKALQRRSPKGTWIEDENGWSKKTTEPERRKRNSGSTDND